MHDHRSRPEPLRRADSPTNPQPTLPRRSSDDWAVGDRCFVLRNWIFWYVCPTKMYVQRCRMDACLEVGSSRKAGPKGRLADDATIVPAHNVFRSLREAAEAAADWNRGVARNPLLQEPEDPV